VFSSLLSMFLATGAILICEYIRIYESVLRVGIFVVRYGDANKVLRSRAIFWGIAVLLNTLV